MHGSDSQSDARPRLTIDDTRLHGSLDACVREPLIFEDIDEVSVQQQFGLR